MKRNLKNILMGVSLVIVMGLMAFTIYEAKENVNTTTSGNMPNMSEMGNPPSKPDGESSTNEPPSKPEGSDSSSSEPPSKPEGSDSSNEPPSKPDGENESSSEGNIPSKPEGNESQGMPSDSKGVSNTSSSIDTKYYVFFGVESLVLSLIIMYLVMSKFNKKSFKETFGNSDKIIIIILSTIVLTGGLTLLDGFITKSISNESINPINNSNSTGSSTSSAVTNITTDKTITSGEYSSSNSDENAIGINGEVEVSLSDISVSKTGDSDGGDNTSFYGTNSAILVSGGAEATIDNITVETNATGANGVFSYGGSATTNNSSSDGTTVNISNSKITTTKDNSGGIMTTGGGKMVATNLTINTSGTSSAAVRTDRGGGEVTVNKGTYTTTGKGSPVVYSTADVTVSNATLVAKASEGIVIEGKNSVTLNKVKLTDTNNTLNGNSTTYKNIFIYQSMSGDASEGKGVFTSKNSEIITNNGDTFYVTNTSAEINLTNNTITNNDEDGAFLRVQKDSWGSVGSNGGEVTLNLNNQKVKGDIIVDSISTLEMNLTNKSSFEGVINSDNEAKSITLTIDKTSSIKLTGNIYVTSFENADSSNSNIDFNGYKIYVNGTSIN